ncbi:uncharacterized protein LOC123290836 isoform X2 [Chrysoperla carnea]|uniref:uncharacterized protein LOC123290836 isoform X2 n=1 Tax=Chrysoperla carnea TaxID=189513 RepID=UPI001D08F453|nr:uncharacterized protein LOC123290836 isoform X2 [Chrysoperla carnea]
MPSKKRLTRLEERLQKEAQKLKSQLEKELAPKREPLHLQCVDEDLTSAQLSYQNRLAKELKDATHKLEKAMASGPSEIIYKGEYVQSYQIGNAKPPSNSSSKGGQNTYQLVMDPRSGLIVGGMGQAQLIQAGQQTPTSTTPPPSRSSKKNSRSSSSSRSKPSTPLNATPQIPANIRPTEGTAVGGLATGKPPPIVDLTTDDGRPAPDSREVSFNKLQGKTFPSLVVVARPHLRAKEVASVNDRPALDAKVKSVLMHTPTKFTEWLIQQGLVRSEQTCVVHPQTKLKLGMYSDVSKFPYSGGYVWISECCPQRFVSVFSGSLFEAASHPPSVLLKLIYHWACQTNVQNIVQWVKVDNLYVKGLFTWLRAACTTALQNFNLMGGKNKRIEVGVISLGTTSQDGHQRQVKVEVLGILDPEAKQIRLRAVEPLADSDSRNYKRRFSKILEPLIAWVHKDSIIMTDLTVDKSCLNSLGFEYVVQSSASDATSGNQTVMEYLRRIVPRMFQNTLSLLSHQIIQQFLDELVWREWYGPTAAQAFDNIVLHLAEQTRQNTPYTLIVRLNKIAANPFKNWSFYHQNYEKQLDNDELLALANNNSIPATTPTSAPKQYTARNRKRNYSSISGEASPQPSSKSKKTGAQQVNTVIDLDDETVDNRSSGALESYYYGTLDGKESNMQQKVKINIKCCSCKMTFTNNIHLLDHLLAHAHNVSTGANAVQCRFCLAMLGSSDALESHINESHPCDTFVSNALICVICETRFTTANQLTKHMTNTHVAAELPYECGTCYHRTSSHRAAIEHFYNEHDGTAMLQCPFCLKSISVWNIGRAYNQNVTFFMAHLQKHQKKGTAKKCNRCALWFVHKGTLKEHQQRSHNSLIGKRNLHMWQPTSNSVILARATAPQQSAYSSQPSPEPEPLQELFDDMVVILPDEELKCKECDLDVGDEDHYTGVLNCNKCCYVTCCKHAMDDHSISCKDSVFGTVTPAPLRNEMHCVCGYSSNDGNILAKHLALCERKSAYPSVEAAKAAIVTHSMLDVLGLVRRPEEPGATETKKPLDSELAVKEEADIVIETEGVQDSDSNLVEITETSVETKVETQSPISHEVSDLVEDSENIENVENVTSKDDEENPENTENTTKVENENDEPAVVKDGDDDDVEMEPATSLLDKLPTSIEENLESMEVDE